MPDITVDISLYCSCGKGICNNATATTINGNPTFTIEPCEKCISAARDAGYDDGYAVAERLNDNRE